MHKNLRAEMVKAEMTQRVLSRITGISISALSKKINGGSEFTFRECRQIKEALKSEMSIDELFS